MTVRAYCAGMRRCHTIETADKITGPSYAADHGKAEVSPGQGKVLFDHLTGPRKCRLFTEAEGAEGHCEGMARSCSGTPRSTGWARCCPAERGYMVPKVPRHGVAGLGPGR